MEHIYIMVISWLGLSCFKIQTKLENREVTLVTDPYDGGAGIKLPRNLSADVVTISHKHPLHSNYNDVAGAEEKKKPFLVDAPGEYEIGGIFIYGIREESNGKEKSKNTIYKIEAEGISVAHLGNTSGGFSEKEMENFGEVDILLVPVGGESLSVKKAAELVGIIEPRIVVPMHYKLPELKSDLEAVDKFLREMSVGKVEPAPKLKVARKDLPSDEMKVVVLERA